MTIVEKHEELLMSEKFDRLDESQINETALMIENTVTQVARDATEGTISADVQGFVPLIAPVVRRAFPKLIANDILGVQPMKSPTGLIYFLDFKYAGKGANYTDRVNGRVHGDLYDADTAARTCGTATQTSLILDLQNKSLVGKTDKEIKEDVFYQGSGLGINGTIAKWSIVHAEKIAADKARVLIVVVPNEVEKGKDPVLPSTSDIAADIELIKATKESDFGNSSATAIVGVYSNQLVYPKILKTYSGPFPTCKAEELGYDMPEIKLELVSGSTINSVTASAKSRKLKAEYTVELYQDLKNLYGIEADKELSAMMTREVLAEIDREIVDAVNSWALQLPDFVIAPKENETSFKGRHEIEALRTLGMKISAAAMDIARTTKRGRGNVIICSPKVATVLEELKGYECGTCTKEAKSGTITRAGTYRGMKVIIDNEATYEYVTVLYKGETRNDSIGFYAPYVPISFTKVTHAESGQPAIILNTRYDLVRSPLDEKGASYGRTFMVDFTGTTLA